MKKFIALATTLLYHAAGNSMDLQPSQPGRDQPWKKFANLHVVKTGGCYEQQKAESLKLFRELIQKRQELKLQEKQQKKV